MSENPFKVGQVWLNVASRSRFKVGKTYERALEWEAYDSEQDEYINSSEVKRGFWSLSSEESEITSPLGADGYNPPVFPGRGENYLRSAKQIIEEDSEELAQEENQFAEQVWAVLDRIGNLLIEKNEAYGDAALNPIRIFSKADTLEQLRVRIDDKLNRLAKGHEYPSEDTVDDLLGYLVLYKIGERNG